MAPTAGAIVIGITRSLEPATKKQMNFPFSLNLRTRSVPSEVVFGAIIVKRPSGDIVDVMDSCLTPGGIVIRRRNLRNQQKVSLRNFLLLIGLGELEDNLLPRNTAIWIFALIMFGYFKQIFTINEQLAQLFLRNTVNNDVFIGGFHHDFIGLKVRDVHHDLSRNET